jgi:hypothetical protein
VGDGTNGNIRTTPASVSGLSSGVASIGAGYFHTCARLAGSGDTGIKCWGHDLFAQLGNGKTVNNPTPQSVVLDSDRDGCTNNAELGSNPDIGGSRDPYNYWDFFDTPDSSNIRDRIVTVADITRIQSSQRYFTNGDATVDPLSVPPASGYHPAFDRTFAGPGQEDSGPANGQIRIDDIQNANRQYFDDCR